MKITDLLKKQSICLDGKADSKEQVIREMVDLMAEGGNINDIDTYRETVFKREEEGTQHRIQRTMYIWKYSVVCPCF